MPLNTGLVADFTFLGSAYDDGDSPILGWGAESTGLMAGAGASGNIGAPGYGGFISGEDWWQKNKNRLGERPDNFAANGLDSQGNPILTTQTQDAKTIFADNVANAVNNPAQITDDILDTPVAYDADTYEYRPDYNFQQI